MKKRKSKSKTSRTAYPRKSWDRGLQVFNNANMYYVCMYRHIYIYVYIYIHMVYGIPYYAMQSYDMCIHIFAYG